MNNMLEKYRDKKILIWGYGREGKSTEKFFKKYPVAASVEISEAKPDEIDYDSCDYIFKSPGIRLAYPLRERFPEFSPILQKLTSQTELFIGAFRDRVIGITGTKGKSTTTALLHHVLNSCRDGGACLVGNIGVPCLDLFDEMMAGDAVAVFELSCHQLAYASVSPHIGIFLNQYEDHLDFYGDRETYFHAKRHLTDFQTEEDWLYVGTDVPELTTRARVVRVTDHYRDDAMHLLGEHNHYNASFVNHVATERFGLDAAAVKEAIDSFTGLPHRLQFIGTVDGVQYYDDSISTIPEATIQAVESVPEVATVILGGMDREIDYTPLIRFIPTHKNVIFICAYASGKRIYEAVSGEKENLRPVSDLKEAVALAKQLTPAGKACVLSPAAASYGYFKNFEERGDRFAELVREG